MGVLLTVEFPDNQIVHIDNYEIGEIKSKYIEQSPEGDKFILKFNEYENCELTIEHLFVEQNHTGSVECYRIELTGDYNEVTRLITEVKLIDTEHDEALTLADLYTIYKLSHSDNDEQPLYEYENCSIFSFLSQKGNINTFRIDISEFYIDYSLELP